MTYDIVVVGTGGVGSAALYHLAKKGVKVLGIDRFPPAHDRGSSHGITRIIRKAYFEHPDYVPLLLRAYKLWRELELENDTDLFRIHPLVEIGPPDGDIVPGVLSAARQHNLEVTKLNRDEFSKRFPTLRLPDDHLAVVEEDAGFLYVEKCVAEHINSAIKHGAKTLTGTEVTGWTASNESIEIHTDKETISAGSLIISPGAWANDLLGNLGVEFKVIKKHLHWFECDDTVSADSGFPIFFYENTDGYFYGLPKVDPLGLKLSEHSGGTQVGNPLTESRGLDDTDCQRVESFLQNHIPGVSRNRTRHETCFYTMSSDGHFIVDRHPEYPKICFAAGLSGHGFKFTCILGEALADLALGSDPVIPMDLLKLSRFGS